MTFARATRPGCRLDVVSIDTTPLYDPIAEADAYEAERDAQDARAAELAAARLDVRDPDARVARLTADQHAADTAIAIQALDPKPIDPLGCEPAMRRSAEESETSTVEARRRERDRFAYSLYADLRSDVEIRAALCATYGISDATARDDMRAVRAIVASWRDHTEWSARRDQHMMALRSIHDLAKQRGDDRGLEVARKVLSDMRAVEGFTAPTRGVIVHGHGIASGGNLPDGPGVIAGIRILDLTPGQRQAMLALLPPAALEAAQEDRGEAIDAVGVEADGALVRAMEASLDATGGAPSQADDSDDDHDP